ncbi:hypothetical protein HUJ04_013246 [Dendroctonus ponderosae]
MKPTPHPTANTFLFLADKDVSQISGIWKAIHISIYVALAVVAFVTSMAAGNMFQTFNYNCVLYCTEIQFEVVQLEAGEVEERNATVGNQLENATQVALNSDAEWGNQSKSQALNGTAFQASIDLSKTVFPPHYWCNFVLATALISFIFSTFCVVLLAMCSKGGKGHDNTLNRPQNIVYPILVSSIILLVLNSVASLVVKRGMQQFCATFQDFAHQDSCSSSINLFTIHERQRDFYTPYLVLAHAFNIAIILITGQLVLTLLRVIYAVDYQLYALEAREDRLELEGEILESERAL